MQNNMMSHSAINTLIMSIIWTRDKQRFLIVHFVASSLRNKSRFLIMFSSLSLKDLKIEVP